MRPLWKLFCFCYSITQSIFVLGTLYSCLCVYLLCFCLPVRQPARASQPKCQIEFAASEHSQHKLIKLATVSRSTWRISVFSCKSHVQLVCECVCVSALCVSVYLYLYFAFCSLSQCLCVSALFVCHFNSVRVYRFSVLPYAGPISLCMCECVCVFYCARVCVV